MSKKQKIWFAVFLAMFAVPEVLWGLVNTFLFKMSLFPPLQSNKLNALIVSIEFVGILFATIISFLFYTPPNIFLRATIRIVFLILLLLTFYLLLFSFNFNPQI